MLALVANFLTRPSSHWLASRLKSSSGFIDDDNFSQKPKVVKKSRKVIKPMDYESLPRVVNTKRTTSDVLFIQPRRKKKEYVGDLPKTVYFQVSSLKKFC